MAQLQLPDSLASTCCVGKLSGTCELVLGCCRVSGKWSMISERMCFVCVCVVGDD